MKSKNLSEKILRLIKSKGFNNIELEPVLETKYILQRSGENFRKLIFSFNDMLVKFLADDYALHQIVFTRSIVSCFLLVTVVVPLAGGFGLLRTKRIKLHLLRALFVIAANLFFFTALADLPLATVVSIFFVAPF